MHQERLEFIQMTQTLAARVVELSECLESAREARKELETRAELALRLLVDVRSLKAGAAAEILKGNYDRNYDGHSQS